MKIKDNAQVGLPNERPDYTAPKLTVLDLGQTKTGGTPDPNEFTPILQGS